MNKRQIDEFIKEFCNLMGGGVKEHFEKKRTKHPNEPSSSHKRPR